MRQGLPWTDEQDLKLTDLWLKGLTAKKIVDEFPERTKNAIIGRVHRLGLQRNISNRGNEVPKRKRKRTEKRMPLPKPDKPIVLPSPPIVPEPQLFPENPTGLSLMELRWHHCRSIVQDRGGPDGLAVYCGKTSIPGKSFCSEHAAIYYRPYQPRRRG